MTWLYDFTVTEWVFIGLFLLLYILYLTRMIRIARTLHTSFSGIAVKMIIRTLYFALLLVALLGPSFGESKREIKSVGKDIFMLVDLSQSMEATDVQPTRLAKVKFELKNIVEEFNSDRMGIIIFSSEAFMQVPLTYDQNALNLFIETLNTGLVPNTGTDFSPPLSMALEKLQDEDSPVTQQKSKVILLISDGEDFGDKTQEIIDEIESEGITLFTLGVGTESGSRIPTRTGFKQNDQGGDVITKLDSRSLKQLANETNGKYFEINETRNDVSRLINTIKSIEGELRDSRQVDVSANRYYYFLIAALALILLDILLSFKTVRI